MSISLNRGDVWLIDLDPTIGTEQAGRRPACIMSIDLFNQGPQRRVMVVPITSVIRSIRWHVPVSPPEGGLRRPSVLLCDQPRSASAERLVAHWGTLAPATLADVEARLRILLDL